MPPRREELHEAIVPEETDQEANQEMADNGDLYSRYRSTWLPCVAEPKPVVNLMGFFLAFQKHQ
jgi:hypothetical protein